MCIRDRITVVGGTITVIGSPLETVVITVVGVGTAVVTLLVGVISDSGQVTTITVVTSDSVMVMRVSVSVPVHDEVVIVTGSV